MMTCIDVLQECTVVSRHIKTKRTRGASITELRTALTERALNACMAVALDRSANGNVSVGTGSWKLVITFHFLLETSVETEFKSLNFTGVNEALLTVIYVALYKSI